jgi:hypothetical protein
MKLLILLILIPVTGCSQVNEWHHLKKLTDSQRQSSSYKFLVSKFGTNGIYTECDTYEAAALGEEYLFQIASLGNSDKDGETIGHGATLQEALDSAANQYMSPEEVREIRKQEAIQEVERKKVEEEYAKKCCKEN